MQNNKQSTTVTGAEKSSTNSPLGSSHNIRTLLCRVKHIGEFLKDKSPAEDILKVWGKNLYEASKELIAAFELTSPPPEEGKDGSVPPDFKELTGHNTQAERRAYESGREDEKKVLIEWIEKWDGSTNSAMGELLSKKCVAPPHPQTINNK